MRRLAPCAVLVLAVLAGAATALAADPQPRKSSEPPPDAELLLQLDILRDQHFAKERQLYSKMSILERMRLLEQLDALDGQPEAAPVRRGGDQ